MVFPLILGRNKLSEVQMSNTEKFVELDQSLQQFIVQLQIGENRLDHLISEISLIQDMVSKEAEKMRKHNESITRAIAKDQVDQLASIFDDKLRGHHVEESLVAQSQRILQSLRFEDMNSRRTQIMDAHNETFNWIFDEPSELSPDIKWDSFPQWLRSDNPIYWICGKAGSGKSTLVSFLIHNVKTKQLLSERDSRTVLISAFIWSAGSPMQRSEKGLLCSLLHEIISKIPALCQPLLSSGKFHEKFSNGDWSRTELRGVLLTSIQSIEQPLCIIIDGLDEIDRADPAEAYNLLRLISDLRSIPNVKLCVSSRPEPLFERNFSQCSHLRVQDLTAHDIRKYVADSISNLNSSDSLGDMKDHIIAVGICSEEKSKFLIDQIAEKANGVFLWVYLVVSSIRNGLINFDSWDMLIQRIDELPSSLNKLYDTMWKRVNGDSRLYRSQAALYLNMLLNSPISHLNLLEMMLGSETDLQQSLLNGGARHSDADIYRRCKVFYHQVLARCGGLVEFRPMTTARNIRSQYFILINSKEESEDVHQVLQSAMSLNAQFLHRSALDFLKETPEGHDILRQDSKSALERTYSALQANIAAALIVRCSPGYCMESFRIIDSGGSVLNADTMIVFFNLIKTTFERIQERTRSDDWLLYLAARYGYFEYVTRCVSCWDPQDPDTKQRMGRLLMHSVDTGDLFGMEDKNRLISWLLQQGAECTELEPGVDTITYQKPLISFLLYLESILTGNPKYLADNSAILKEIRTCGVGKVDMNTRFIASLGPSTNRIQNIVRFPVVNYIGIGVHVMHFQNKTRSMVVLIEISIPHIFGRNPERLQSLLDARIREDTFLESFQRLMDLDKAHRPKAIMMLNQILDKTGKMQNLFSKPVMDLDVSDALLEGTRLGARVETGKQPQDGIYGPLPHSGGSTLISNESKLLEFYNNYEERTLDARETVEWLVRKGYLPENVLKNDNPLEILVREDSIYRGRTPLEEIDNASRPEYEELSRAVYGLIEHEQKAGNPAAFPPYHNTKLSA